MATQNLDIMTLPLEEAWNVIKVLDCDNTTYKKARFGIQIPFDINDYIKERIIIKAKSNIAIIKGKPYSLTDFETELEQREKTIKEWLNKNYGKTPLSQPRALTQR